MGSLSSAPVRVLGRYALHGEIAHGGMATIHFGRLLGVVGFTKTVAIKRLHPQFAKDPEFVSMFLDEARLAARIRHPNVVSTLDVVALEGELFLVMEYVLGDSLQSLIRLAAKQATRIPPQIVASILAGALHGLHAAHEAKSERSEPLGIVHRDVSPQNILVGSDGVTRMLDFGVAKAAGRAHTTREGQLKGKLAYMSPEQLHGTATRTTDIWAAAVVLWEALVGRRLFAGASEGETVKRVLDQPIEPPSKFVPGLPRQLDEVTLRGLRRNPDERFLTAREMVKELERAVTLASTSDVGEFVERTAGSVLANRAEAMAEIESSSSSRLVVPAPTADASPERPLEASTVGATVTESHGMPSGASEVLALRRRAIRRVLVVAVGLSGALILVALGVALGARRAADREHPASVAASAPPPALPEPMVTEAAAVVAVSAPPQSLPEPSAAASTAPPDTAGSSSPPLRAPAAPRIRPRPPPVPRSAANPLEGVLDSRK